MPALFLPAPNQAQGFSKINIMAAMFAVIYTFMHALQPDVSFNEAALAGMACFYMLDTLCCALYVFGQPNPLAPSPSN